MEPKVPNKTQMRRYLERKLTQQQIKDEWEKDSGISVSRSAIGMAIKRYDLQSVIPRPRYEDLLPWRVTEQHRMHRDARMLRAEARTRRGLDLEPDVANMHASWRQRLKDNNVVITYDTATNAGFRWVPREESDGDSLIRP